jgi:putative glutamine amidotransferase
MGGPDIPPILYGQSAHLLTRVTDPYRHYLELSFLFHLLGGSQDMHWDPYLEENPEYLISGICLGMQSLHVATGGTMVQDIPTELYGTWKVEDILNMPDDQKHRTYFDLDRPDGPKPTSYHFHRIRIQKGSFLDGLVSGQESLEPLVLSSHHQAVEKKSGAWKTSAHSMDGKIVEAMEHKRFPRVVGVQFHPEKPGIFDPAIKHTNPGGEESSFFEKVEETTSFDFHLAYWNWLGESLQLIRSR